MTPSGFFAFRTAALPMRVLTEWDRLTTIASRPEVRAALWLASPDLVDAMDSRPGDAGVEGAVVRYVTRMASRATPFGLFAACGTGLVGDRTDLRLPEPASWGRFTQLDADYLDALVRQRAADLADRVTYVANDSLHLMAGRWRYVESRLDGLERSHHLVQVAGSKHLQRALDAAAGGASRREIVDAVAAGGVDEPRAAAFTDRLVDAQVLVPTLAVTITGPPPLDTLITDLDALGDESTASVLRAVRDDLAAIDAEGPAAPPERHAAIAGLLSALPATIDRARLLHVDATVPPCGAQLARRVVDDIARAVDVLRRIAPPAPPSDLDRFRADFLARYDTEEVPLLDALDEELGVGFGGDGDRRDPAPLLDGLRLPPATGHQATLGRRERRLLELLHRAWADGAHEIVLTKDDVAAMSNDDAPPLPPALAATAVLGRSTVVLTGASGPSGARLLGRFCHADPELDRHVRDHLRAEEALDPDAVHAEIVHLPDGRMVNVLARPALRDHEIAWLGRSGLPPERVLSAGDLLVSLRDGRFVLRSQRLDRRVVPRLTSAHNYDRRSPGVYRFLAAVQSDGVADRVGWTWFAFTQVPFTPRVRLGSVILARAQWRVAGLRSLDGQTFPALREQHRLPRWICLVEGDNLLPFDLDNARSVGAFIRAVRRADDVMLEELFPGPDELGDDHAVEVVVPFIAAAPARRADVVPVRAVRRVFPPGSEWTYLKLYAGSATADRLLREEIAPLAHRLVASGAADSWFFIRYEDPGFHLRVRFHGEPDAIRPAVDALVAKVLDQRLAHDAAMATYRREVERYGGPDGIDVAERVFHADSDAAVDLLDLFQPGEPGLEARWRVGVLGAERLLVDLGLDATTRAALSRRMRDSFDREFRADAALRRGVAGRVREHLASLDDLVELAPGVAVLDQRSARIAPLARQVPEPVEALAASFVHMWLNRLHRSENRFHEYVTYALLARLHEARAHR